MPTSGNLTNRETIDANVLEIENGATLDTKMPIRSVLTCSSEGENVRMEVGLEAESETQLPVDNLGKSEFNCTYDKNGILRKVNLTTLFGASTVVADNERERGYKERNLSALDVASHSDNIKKNEETEFDNEVEWKVSESGSQKSGVATILGEVESTVITALQEPEVNFTLTKKDNALVWKVSSIAPPPKGKQKGTIVETKEIQFTQENLEGLDVMVGTRKITITPKNKVKETRNYIQIVISEDLGNGNLIEKIITLPIKIDTEYIEDLFLDSKENLPNFEEKIPITIKYPV